MPRDNGISGPNFLDYMNSQIYYSVVERLPMYKKPIACLIGQVVAGVALKNSEVALVAPKMNKRSMFEREKYVY